MPLSTNQSFGTDGTFGSHAVFFFASNVGLKLSALQTGRSDGKSGQNPRLSPPENVCGGAPASPA